MTNLKIAPSFKARNIQPRLSKKIIHPVSSPNNVTKRTKKISLWDYLDKKITSFVKKHNKRKYSTEKISHSIELDLEKRGINIRFNNNSKLAQCIQTGINLLEEKNIPTPKNIYFVSPLIRKIGILGLTYMLKDKKESPIILPSDIADKEDECIMDYNKGNHTTPSLLHIFFHETGHWLHYQKGFDIEENYKIWKEIDLENISKNISKLATKSQDGSDFCAEIFAGQMFNKSFSDEYIELAQKLNAPLIERDAQ